MQALFQLPVLTEYSMILTMIVLLVGGFLSLLAGQRSEKGGFIIAVLFLAMGLFLNILLLLGIWDGGTISQSFVWLGDAAAPIMTMGFLGDGLSTPVAILIIALGLFSVIFSSSFMQELKNPGYYYGLIVWFIAAMVGVIYATNLMQFFVFYELMLIPAFILVYLYGVSEDAAERTKNALQFWVWTAAGGLISLFAVFWLFGLTGTMDIVTIQTSSIPTAVARSIGIIFLLGFSVKLGLVPLHVWAPRVYGEAPIPILVLLSGAMTKTAAYGVIRIVIPTFAEAMVELSSGLMVLALITMFYGAMLAIAQKDLKMMLAYSSISQLGYLMFGYSTMTLTGLNGAALHLINHGILASMMFFAAGAIKLKAGSMDFDKLGGLAPKMPALATVSLIGALALAGTPPLSAFAGELMIFLGAAERAASVGADASFFLMMTVLGVVATGLTAGYYLWAIRRVFYGQVPEELSGIKDPDYRILLILAIMSFFVIALGVWPELLWRFVNPVLSLMFGGGA